MCRAWSLNFPSACPQNLKYKLLKIIVIYILLNHIRFWATTWNNVHHVSESYILDTAAIVLGGMHAQNFYSFYRSSSTYMRAAVQIKYLAYKVRVWYAALGLNVRGDAFHFILSKQIRYLRLQ